MLIKLDCILTLVLILIFFSSSALDTMTKKKVAIKKLARPFQTDVHAKRTYRELKLLKHMRHENVIGLLDVFYPKHDNNQVCPDFLSNKLSRNVPYRLKYGNSGLDKSPLVSRILRKVEWKEVLDRESTHIVVNKESWLHEFTVYELHERNTSLNKCYKLM